MRKVIFLFSFLMSVTMLSGQEPQQKMSKKWRDYFSYKNCFSVVETDQGVVGATSLGLILYDRSTQSLAVKNKTNGLSDSGLSALGYITGRQMILVGYGNGNIDLIDRNGVYNIPDLKIDNMVGSKKINHFFLLNNRLFCSTDFGILVIDPEKKEISATYYIGEEATSLSVSGMVADDESIYAATSKGVLRAPRNSRQLAFYQTWERISSGVEPYCDIEFSDSGILAVRGEKGKSVSLERVDNGVVVKSFSDFRSLDAGTQGVVVVADKIFVYNNQLQLQQTISKINAGDEVFQPSYRKAVITSEGNLWVATFDRGLFVRQTGDVWQQVLPPGPVSNRVLNVNTVGGDLWVLPGGFTSTLNNAKVPAYISVYGKEGWRYFDRSNTPEFKGALDLVNMVVSPQNPDKALVASWGGGIYEFNSNILSSHYMKDNSGLQNIDWAGKNYTRIWGLDYDKENNLWITNSSVENGVVVLTSDNQWIQYGYASLSAPNAIGPILAGPEGYKWLIVFRGDAKGIFVFDDNKTLDNQDDDLYRGAIPPMLESDSRNAGQLLLWDEKGEEIARDIYCMAFDQNGYLWLGTGRGVLVQYNPSGVFRDEKPVFSRIKVARDDGSGLADYLLDNKRITSIAVDGANRKYIGTQNSGAYLVSEDGTKTIASFNTGNSALPSNMINHIHIDQESGEVFMATSMGLVSFKGDAVKGRQVFQDVYAYPNPVRSDYTGPITISGLMERTIVKITDTAGNLVYQTTSLGGNALWNGKNLWGRKVKPGIYIVLLSSPDGFNTAFTKIAIIR